jgi:hypothetical protein
MIAMAIECPVCRADPVESVLGDDASAGSQQDGSLQWLPIELTMVNDLP